MEALLQQARAEALGLRIHVQELEDKLSSLEAACRQLQGEVWSAPPPLVVDCNPPLFVRQGGAEGIAMWDDSLMQAAVEALVEVS